MLAMTVFESLMQLALLAGIFCVLMPMVGGSLLHHGLQRVRVDQPLALCLKVFFGATGTAYLIMMGVGRMLPEPGKLTGILFTAGIVVVVELAFIALLLRKGTRAALLVEAAVVLLTNTIGYGLVLSFTVNSGPVLAGR